MTCSARGHSVEKVPWCNWLFGLRFHVFRGLQLPESVDKDEFRDREYMKCSKHDVKIVMGAQARQKADFRPVTVRLDALDFATA